MADPRPNLYDMHCHLGFSDDPVALAHDLAGQGVVCWSQTVTPQEYEQQRSWFAGSRPNRGAEPPALWGSASFVRLGAGLHPWWLACDPAEARAQAEALAALVTETSFVGEVGLDFARHGIAAPEAQEAAFRLVALECARMGGRAVSIHAVGKGAAGRVLDILEDARFFADGSNRAVFHWFSGSSDELARARKLGCCFSVGLAMLGSKRGRAYAAQIPEAQLLLETDLPQNPECGSPRQLADEAAAATADLMAARLAETLSSLAVLRNVDAGLLGDALRCSSRMILDL